MQVPVVKFWWYRDSLCTDEWKMTAFLHPDKALSVFLNSNCGQENVIFGWENFPKPTYEYWKNWEQYNV
eukprot:12963692-Ditylum_brightwellii.AAC.1